MKMTITPDGAMHFEGFEPSQIPDLIKFTYPISASQPVIEKPILPTFEIHPQLALIDEVESTVTTDTPVTNLADHFQEKQLKSSKRSDYHQRSKLPIFNNYQFETDAQAKQLDINHLDMAMNSPILRLNFDKSYLLPDSSKQVKGRSAIVTWFFKTGNRPLTRDQLVDAFKLDPDTQHINCVATYLNHLRHIGVVAKDRNSAKYHLSTWFLTKIQYIPF